MRHGYDTWLMLVQPTSHVVTMEADTSAGAGGYSGLLPEASPWNDLVVEFADFLTRLECQQNTKPCTESNWNLVVHLSLGTSTKFQLLNSQKYI